MIHFFAFLAFSIQAFCLQYQKGEVLMKLKEEVGVKIFERNGVELFGIEKLDELNLQFGVYKIKRLFPAFEKEKRTFTFFGKTKDVPDLSRIYHIFYEKEIDAAEVANAYNKCEHVEWAEPNYILELFSHPPHPLDPGFSLQWALCQHNDHDVDACEAWKIAKGEGVIVAIIDTGCDLDHPDLQENLIEGYDFINNDSTPEDIDGHGTHVAGTVAAAMNEVGIVGLAYNCEVMPIKCGNVGEINLDAAARGIRWAVDRGAKVVNMSFGGNTPLNTLKAAIDYGISKGVFFVAAAGNDNSSTPIYPAAYPEVMAVAATDQNDRKATFSNYGPWIDIAAPGVDIYSTIPNSYGYKSGTSMAAPYVAAAAALLFSYKPTLSIEEVWKKLIDGTDKKDYCRTVGIGGGRLNAYQALAGILRVSPNPFHPKIKGVRFENLPYGNIHIRIYTLEGDIVKELKEHAENLPKIDERAYWEWDGRNMEGRMCASGLYFYILKVDGRLISKGALLLVK